MGQPPGPTDGRGTARDDDAWGSAHVVVDAMNVIGSRPTGWWRDRDGAVAEFVARLARWVAGLDSDVHVVIDGRPVDGATGGDVSSLDVRYAPRRGPDAADDAIVELLEELGEVEGTVTVVTADRELRRRVEARGAAVTGPTSLLHRLDEQDSGSSTGPRGGDEASE